MALAAPPVPSTQGFLVMGFQQGAQGVLKTRYIGIITMQFAIDELYAIAGADLFHHIALVMEVR